MTTTPEQIAAGPVRRHHHEDCIACSLGECNGSTWIDPAYPVGGDPKWLTWLAGVFASVRAIIKNQPNDQ